MDFDDSIVSMNIKDGLIFVRKNYVLNIIMLLHSTVNER